MKIIMLGAPGAGKGTQAKQIADKYGVPHISTGDIFRANIKNGTELGKKAKEYMDQGLLVPDELTCDLVMDRIQQDDCKNGFILDGFPRTPAQAEALDKSGTKIDAVLNIVVADEEIIRRLAGRLECSKCAATYHKLYNKPAVDGVCDKCGGELVTRADDQPETIKSRLQIYHGATEPLLTYYRNKGILKTVEGHSGIAETTAEVLRVLEG